MKVHSIISAFAGILALGATASAQTTTTTSTGTFRLADIPSSAPLANVSVRSTLASGQSTTVGFVVGGTMPRRVLVRAIGPGLAAFGVTNGLSNPSFTLYRGTQAIATN